MSDEKQPESTDSSAEDAAIESAPDNVPEELVGVAILVIGYTQEKAADETLKAMKDGEFYFEDAAVIRQDAKGKVHISETEDMSTGKGAGIGAVVGGLLGLLAGPGGVVLGAGVGAGVGGALAHHDAGFRKEGLEDVGAALQPGTSALVITTSKEFVEQMRKEVPEADLADASRRIAQDISDSLSAGKDMALGLLFTEQGIGVREIRVDDESAEIYGLLVTDDAIAGGAAVVTKDGAAFEGAVATVGGAEYVAGVVTDEGAIVADAIATDNEIIEDVAVILPEDEADADAAASKSEDKDKTA